MNRNHKKPDIKAIASDLARAPSEILESIIDFLAMVKDIEVNKALLKELVLSYSISERELSKTLRERNYLLDILSRDLKEASEYVKSTLPNPIKSLPLEADWRFIPATSVGGDSFGYHFLDDEHFVVFLLDVSGHGVGSALLSMSVTNFLRTRPMSDVDFRAPDQVLTALNAAFPASDHYEMFFTIWYGVYNINTRELSYASGGHPPALLLSTEPDPMPQVVDLRTPGPFIGNDSGFEYWKKRSVIPPSSRLYIFSDGVFEIRKDDRMLWDFDSFRDFIGGPATSEQSKLDDLVNHVRELSGAEVFEDDFSIIEIVFK